MKKKICEDLNYNFDGTLNGTQKTYEDQIKNLTNINNKITRKEIANVLKISVRTVQRIINKSSKISYIGIGKSGYW